MSASTRAASAPCLQQLSISAKHRQQANQPGLRAMAELSDGLEARDSEAAPLERGTGSGTSASRDDSPAEMPSPETLDGYVLQVPQHRCRVARLLCRPPYAAGARLSCCSICRLHTICDRTSLRWVETGDP